MSFVLVALVVGGCGRSGPGPAAPEPVVVQPASAPVEVAEPAPKNEVTPSEAELQAALARDLRDARAYEGLARLYYDRSLSQRSYAILARRIVAQGLAVLGRDGRVSADLLTTRGLLELADGRPDRATQDFTAAVEVDPGDLRAQAALGELALRIRDHARARAAFAAVVAARGDGDPRALAGLGMAEMGLGELAAAEATLRRAAQAAPLDPWAHYRLGRVMSLRDEVEGLEREQEYDVHFARAHALAGEDPRFAEVRARAADRGSMRRYTICYYPIGTFYGTEEEHAAWRALKSAEAQERGRRRGSEAGERARLLELERAAAAAGSTPGERERLLELERAAAAADEQAW